MADADLDVVIRQLAKQQGESLMAAAKKRRDRFSGLAAKAKNSEATTAMARCRVENGVGISRNSAIGGRMT